MGGQGVGRVALGGQEETLVTNFIQNFMQSPGPPANLHLVQDIRDLVLQSIYCVNESLFLHYQLVSFSLLNNDFFFLGDQYLRQRKK